MADSTIRVLLAEDSPTVRHYLVRLINDTPGLKVVGEARDGREVVEMAQTLRPDVISMDIRMPGMDGLEATRQIMALCPTPIVVVSGLVEDDIDLSFRALQAGAVAVVEKQFSRQGVKNAQQRHIGHTLAAMAGVRVIRRWERPPGQNGTTAASLLPATRTATTPEILAIGASAGGPSALSSMLSGLPAGLPMPVVIVQHMPEEFVIGLSRWLTKVTPLPVEIATHNRLLKPGIAYLSPGNAHLAVSRQGQFLVANLIHEAGGYRYQPAVDVLFESAAATCGAAAIGIILTGMGDDGAAGMLAMRKAGAHTFAQDKASSTVFGMPAAAIERGGVEQVMALERLPDAVLRLIG